MVMVAHFLARSHFQIARFILLALCFAVKEKSDDRAD